MAFVSFGLKLVDGYTQAQVEPMGRALSLSRVSRTLLQPQLSWYSGLQ
jgi:hypothetical protein